MSFDSACSAVESGDIGTLQDMLRSNPDLASSRSPDGDTLLHIACWCKQVGVIGILLAHKSDVNAIGCYGRTPLHYAVHEGNAITPILVAAMLQAGADSTIRDENGFRPLDWAKVEMDIGLSDTLKLLSGK